MAIQGAPTGLWVRYLHVQLPTLHLFLAELYIAYYSMQGARETARIILRTDGVPGLYRGFGTVVFGAIPARIVSHLWWGWHQCFSCPKLMQYATCGHTHVPASSMSCCLWIAPTKTPVLCHSLVLLLLLTWELTVQSEEAR